MEGAERMNDSDRPSDSRKAIDESLKRVYQETIEENIPDRFLALLQRLRDGETTPGEAEIEEVR